MTYKIIEDGINKGTVVVENGIAVNDMVSVMHYGSVYPTYYNAFKHFWGSPNDSFHSSGGGLLQHYIERGLYANIWRVINIAKHGTLGVIVCHIKDVYGRNLVVDINALRTIKEVQNKPSAIEIQIIKDNR